MLQQYVPILVKFLHATTKGGVESLSDVVSELLTHILDVCQAPYSEPPPPPDSYLPPAESELSIFPELPFQLGKGNYAAVHVQKHKHSDSCRKLSYGRPSLSPGIFHVILS